jgi:type IV secretion system protein TrbG
MVVKPTDVGLETNLVFFSDRRVYHFVLKSHRTEYMPRVSFVYPDDVLTKWQSMRTKEQAQRQSRTTQSGEYLGELDFEYDVSGNAPWKPVRVYNDGVKTVIQMPAEMKQTEAPALLVLKRPGGIIRDEELAVVNYRLHGNRYVVDNLFETAILVAGVGRSQERITITRRERQ